MENNIKTFDDFLSEGEEKKETGEIVGLNQSAGLLRKRQKTYDSAKVSFGYASEHGIGVFTRTDIRAGEVIEVCPFLVVDKMAMAVDNLNDYLFTIDKEQELYALALGYGSLYNHSEEDNAEWVLDIEREQIRFVAKKDLLPGQEITINYGSAYWNSRQSETGEDEEGEENEEN